ncbi:mitochondrial 50S ribosomal protein L5 [Sparassis latifolia]
MSAAVAQVPRISPAVRSIRPTKPPPRIRRPLPRDENRLPIPHVNLVVRDTAPCRLLDHYYNTVRDDIMYMTYKHQPNPKPPRHVRPKYDPEDPYTKHRFNPPIGGNQYFKRPPPLVTPENVVKLERIQLHTHVKESFSSRSHLLGAMMAFRAISGQNEDSGNQHTVEGVELAIGRRSIQGWVRPGAPIGVKVDLKGPRMYDFLGILVDFILPRIREFPGLVMDGASGPLNSPNAASGVVSFGLPPEAMAFFPQIEVNLDAYPKSYGMHVHLITSAKGVGAQNVARALLSGFQVPFARR